MWGCQFADEIMKRNSGLGILNFSGRNVTKVQMQKTFSSKLNQFSSLAVN